MKAKRSGEVGQREKRHGQYYRGERGREMRMFECESFPSHVFKDACFPPECEAIIKIKTSSSEIKFPSTQIVFSFTLNYRDPTSRLEWLSSPYQLDSTISFVSQLVR